MAMGWETDYCLPDDVNWSEVLDISYDQGVAAIVLDGYEDYLRKNPSQKSFLPLPENKPLRGKALGRLHKIENNHKSHLDALSALAGILSKKQIPFLIMKGFSCAQYYPIPEHRNCGDIDIYPGRRFAESNDAIKEAGVDVLDIQHRESRESSLRTIVFFVTFAVQGTKHELWRPNLRPLGMNAFKEKEGK